MAGLLTQNLVATVVALLWYDRLKKWAWAGRNRGFRQGRTGQKGARDAEKTSCGASSEIPDRCYFILARNYSTWLSLALRARVKPNFASQYGSSKCCNDAMKRCGPLWIQ